MRLAASASQPPGLHGEADAGGETLVRPGDDAIFKLFQEHEAAAWGVAYAVVRNRDDASDAVAEAHAKLLRAAPSLAPRALRAYFLRVVHNAAVDIQRRSSRLEPGLVDDHPDPAAREPADALLAEEDRAIVADAFARLPERWRSAVWLIDVEELSTREAGAVLGVSATNAAQLATRGRGRLREHYMQAHVPNHVRPGCGPTVDALGRYAAGSLPPRKRMAVERHLAGCAECTARRCELDDLGVKLRRAFPPLPLALRWRGGRCRAHGLVEGFSAQAAPVVLQAAATSPVIERLAAGATAAVLAVGLSTLAVRGVDPPASPAAQPTAGSPAIVAPEIARTPAGSPPAGRGPATGGAATGALPAATGVAGATGATAATGAPGPVPVLPEAGGAIAAIGGDLRGLDLRGLDLRGVDLSGANLSGVDLSGANLSGVDLSGANLSGVDLSGTNLSGTNLSGTNLSGANLSGANLSSASLAGADLSGVDLKAVDLKAVDLKGVDLSRTLGAPALLPLIGAQPRDLLAPVAPPPSLLPPSLLPPSAVSAAGDLLGSLAPQLPGSAAGPSAGVPVVGPIAPLTDAVTAPLASGLEASTSVAGALTSPLAPVSNLLKGPA